MNNEQWQTLRRVIEGELVEPIPLGFIIDSPWLPGWAGMTVLDYYTSEEMWFAANLKAIREFPEVMFLPGFWSEYGMCTEPSAFGAKCSWSQRELPFAAKCITDIGQISDLEKPDPAADGLCPFVLQRLQHYRDKISKEGHEIRFAVARGPLNIASFLMGTTEFLMAIRTDPDKTHKFLSIITNFLVDWLKLQKKTFPAIDGVLLLDDIVGFCGDADFRETALPYLRQTYQALDVEIKFFHNDAEARVCAPYLAEIGVNLFNFGFECPLSEMQQLTEGKVTLLGNIPPRDVLAQGNAEQVQQCVRETLSAVTDKRRIIFSCGGGMPPDVSTENIKAFIAAARSGY